MTTGGADDRFYAELAPFSEFERFAEFDAYRAVPADWVVLAGDIEGSTAAIAAGRYKLVNLVGAAVITAVLNACRGVEVPFVFGGDGGTVVVPGSRAAEAAASLRRLQAHARSVFGLGLRAAAVPVARLAAEGHELRVRRLRLNGTNHLAMFAGGGIDRVDEILKGPRDDPAILVAAPDDASPDLDGLSCRWEPLEASRGRMIALMVRPLGGDPAVGYRRIVERMAAIFDGLSAHAPASDQTLRFRWPPRGLWLEAKAVARGGRLPVLARAALTSLAQLWSHRRGARVGAYDGPRYLDELKAQTDFRKFDGCLRAVLDCSAAEVAALGEWLEADYRAGRLVYGLHEDRAALMTCLVFSIERSEHVHFVDAAGGGFARAAEGFKRRLRSVQQKSG